MRILASAYCCSPFEGSEHYAGHHFVDQIARHHPVTVLVPAQLRPALESWPHRPNVEFQYLPTPIYVPWERAAAGSYLSSAVSYYLFSALAYARGKRLVRARRFDVAHHVTIANYRFPSLLPFLGVPSILGPLGGGEAVPAGLGVRSTYGAVRRLSLEWSRRDPILQGSFRRAGRLLVANPETAARIGARHAGKVELMTYGFDAGEVPARSPTRDHAAVTVLCVSRLVRHKGIDLLIKAAPAVASELSGRLRVHIYGDGNDAARLAELARATGADRYVEMRPRIDRQGLLRLYRDSDIFCFPSLRDTCPVALLEAMAAGLPAVVLDHSGPGLIVTDECGIRVPPTDQEETARGLAAALCRLAKDAALRAAMGQAARRRILQAFRWDDRGDRLAELYCLVSRGRG